MNRIDDDRLDLNLLTVFAVLMRERSVTRAAVRLGRGQPAVSHALGRLRRLLADPLFVRTGRTLEPTARARELHGRLAPALLAISDAVRAAQPFDPATAEPRYRLGLSDDLQLALLPPLLRLLRARIPHARMIVRNCDHLRAFAMLEAGRSRR